MGREGSYTKAFKNPNTPMGEWFWHTVSGSDIVADGGEGYRNLTDAENGFLAGQQISTEDRDLARTFLWRVKRTPAEYELRFDRAEFELAKKAKEQSNASSE